MTPPRASILLAATNRPEVLDQALLRPGRFDRRITIDRPNLAGRIATLQVPHPQHQAGRGRESEKGGPGHCGLRGRGPCQSGERSGLRAVRKGRKLVTQEDLLAAFELVIAGTEKKGSVLTEFEKKLVAYHEVGHAMVAYRQKHAEPVSRITIVPHTQGALGYTMQTPEEERFLMDRDEIYAELRILLGGRASRKSSIQHHDHRRIQRY